jgi:cell wall-associated NlpC family hydrolase
VPVPLRALIAAVLAPLAVACPVVTAAATAAEPTSVERRVAAATRKLEVVVEQYNGLREDVRRGRREADAIRARIGPLTRGVEERNAEVGAIAAAAYRGGGAHPVIGLLAAGAPEELGGRLALLEHLGRGRNRAAADLAAATASLAAARQALDTLLARERVQGAELAARKTRIEGEIARLDALRGGYSLGPAPGAVPPPDLPPGLAATAVRFAYAQLGKPYEWGGAGPGGYDCSGLTSAAWAAAGVRLPHNARAQYGAVARVSRAQLQPGDLVFYYADIHHVGLFVGGDRIIHAPQHGERIRFDRVGYQPVKGYGRPRG